MGMGNLQLTGGPPHKENHPVQTNKIVFVLANVVLSLLWLRFLVRLIEQWNLMKPDIREGVGVFLAFFCLLWLTMIRDKNGYISLAMACGVLEAVINFVPVF
jgi:predicted tellurium resistance membrane protein TerC